MVKHTKNQQKHIHEPVKIEKISSKKYESSMNKMMKKHQNVLDKLK